MRIALLEALGREGPLTASKAAELLDDTPGNMSWHLQTLAKYGFIEEAGGGRGRSRPWRLVSLGQSFSFDTSEAGPQQEAAGIALEMSLQERNFQGLREWWSQRLSFPVKWRRAAFSVNATAYLTAEEMQRLSEQINDLFTQYKSRLDKADRHPGARPVQVIAFGHPLSPTPAGN